MASFQVPTCLPTPSPEGLPKRLFGDTDLSSSTVACIKRSKTRSQCAALEPGHYQGLIFWDSLSQFYLTREALKEFDKRVRQSRVPSTAQETVQNKTNCPARPENVKQFACKGGPDLSHLRGFACRALTTGDMDPPPTPSTKYKPRLLSEQSPSAQSSPEAERSMDNPSQSTSRINITRKSTPYDKNFKQKLVDHGVYPTTHNYADGSRHPRPENFDTILDRLKQPRASLSPSRFTTSNFEDFQRENNCADGEASTIYSLGPIIGGAMDRKDQKMLNKLFDNLEPLDTSISAPQPDLYEGLAPSSVHVQIRRDLSKFITPSANDSLPAVPNFFGEWKAPDGRLDVAIVQACHDGAVGARGMHRLKNYGRMEEVEQYDNNANSFSSIYHPAAAILQLYSHHMTTCKTAGGNPEYHMILLGSYSMTVDREGFVKGATAYRNLRDLAAEMRVDTVRQATRTAGLL